MVLLCGTLGWSQNHIVLLLLPCAEAPSPQRRGGLAGHVAWLEAFDMTTEDCVCLLRSHRSNAYCM